MVSSVSSNSQFLFTTCNAGSERALKGEMAVIQPTLRVAFSRPGLLTWKADKPFPLEFTLSATFAGTFGFSLGFASTVEEVLHIAQNLKASSSSSNRPLHLHVFGRDEGGMRSEHPDAIKSKTSRIAALENTLRGMSSSTKLWNDQSHDLEKGLPVLDVIVGEENEKYFVGWHYHSDLHSVYPGGSLYSMVPDYAPSRAYGKLLEALDRSGVCMLPGQSALEIGSAPGGACLVMLEKGLTVYGVDPSPHDSEYIIIEIEQFYIGNEITICILY